MKTMKIKKIKLLGSSTVIHFHQDENNVEQITKFKCSQVGAPAFTTDCILLVRFAIERLGLPSEWIGNCEVFFDEIIFVDGVEAQSQGFKLVFLYRVEELNQFCKIQTPIFYEDNLQGAVLAKIDRIKEHAINYINGKRAQRDIFKNENEANDKFENKFDDEQLATLVELKKLN